MPHRRDSASAPSRTRREFLNLAANAGVLPLLGVAGVARGGNETDRNHLDRFGGWTGKQFKATGFFRTEHDGTRWWLVTPEGNAFISFGVNHYHAGWWAQDYNRDHWVKTFGAKRPWDQAWQKGFRDAALADLRRLGLNTLGIHTDAPMLTEPPGKALFPYVKRYEPLVLSHYRKPTAEEIGESGPGFLMRVEGQEVTTRRHDPQSGYGEEKVLDLDVAAVRNLALVVAELDPAAMPVNLWAPVYTEVAIEVLDHRNSVQARRFAGLEPTTHGDLQESFDALVRTLVRLQDQVAAEGVAQAD